MELVYRWCLSQIFQIRAILASNTDSQSFIRHRLEQQAEPHGAPTPHFPDVLGCFARAFLPAYHQVASANFPTTSRPSQGMPARTIDFTCFRRSYCGKNVELSGAARKFRVESFPAKRSERRHRHQRHERGAKMRRYLGLLTTNRSTSCFVAIGNLKSE